MPAAMPAQAEAPDGATFEGHRGLDGRRGAERDQQGALKEESASTTPPNTPPRASTASSAAAGSGPGEAARESAEAAAAAATVAAAEAEASPGLDPASGPESSSGSVEVSVGDPLTGDGDRDPTREAAGVGASGVGGASARAMVRDDDEVDGDGPPKRITLQNYASRDSGAVMLESSPSSKGMPNLLLDSKDKYAITPCQEQQWAVLGLSEDILVKKIIVGSHEKYSSLLKEFQVLASQTYPVNEWLDLGTFTAKFVQGEQTFEIPHPAFSRYLKFKFLSHYGDEFYCTVSQVKVHGSTMLESFQHDWQQSSAEVREVQDFMKKKDPKPSGVAAATATATATAAAVGGGDSGDSTANNGGVPAQGGGGADVNNGAHPAPGSTPQSSDAGVAPSADGTVEHRPHAASAATVGGSAASGAGVGTAAVEDIVRGVPAEMVVPATITTCVGPTGTDGSCRGEVLADKIGSGDGVAGSAASLASEVPAMGGAGPHALGNIDDSAMVDGDGEGSGAGPERVGVDRGEEGATSVSTNDVDRPGRGGEGASGTGGGKAPLASGQRDPPSREENRHQLENGANDGSAAADAEADAAANAFADAGDGGALEDGGVAAGEGHGGGGGEEAQPPRKGIIHSTMEAISKAVHRGDGSKPKDSGAAAKSDGTVGEGDGVSGGSTVSSDASVDGAAMVDDEDAGSLPSGATGSASASAGIGGEAGDGPVRQGEVGTPVGGNTVVPDAAAVDAAPGAPAGGEPPATGKLDSTNTVTVGEGQESSGAISGHSSASEGTTAVPPAQHVGEEAHEPGGADDESGAAGVVGENPAGRPTAGSDAEPEILNSEYVDPSDARPGGGSGTQQAESAVAVEPASEGDGRQHEHTDSTMVEGVGAGVGVAGADHPHPATTISQSTQDESSPSQGSGRLPTTTQPHGGVSAPALHGQAQGVEPSLPVLHLEESNAAMLTAACLNTLTFSEFRDEVLARTQQAQQSAGGGVAIGGQYESIFKTLMNKIKTLEINQSLYSLYIDDVHGCYQDVIAQMLQEQQRARASRSELLNAQAAHLTQIGDQWPAFQQLQAKVIEVEHRMLLSSLAWFTSLFCLVLMLGNCCLKICRGYAGGGAEHGGGGSGRRNGRRRGGMRDRRGCDSCSPSRGAADMCPDDHGTPTSTHTKEPLHWQVDGGGGGDGDVDRSSPPPGLSTWEVASTAERVRVRGAEERYSPGVSRF